MNLVFDFAGVLFHWQPQALLGRLLPHRVRALAEARHWVDAIFESYGGDWAEFDRGALAPDALAQRIAARTGLGVGEALAVIDAVARELQPVPEMVELLQRLDENGVPLFFLSNMPAPYASALEQHGFMRLFRQGIFSGRVGWIKPEREIFALAAERFAIEPAR
ncbi:MAG: HAD hydrolase-like protein, partial [Rhizobacter sp.]|nr:HAD hydrolase-like protein [Rhizobacter sp.]